LALAALIGAYHEAGEAGVLRAVLPLAGRTVIERQARLAAAAGATRIVLVAERMPIELVSAIDRLRRARLPVEVARSAEEAAETIDPDDRLLLIADGAVVDAGQLVRLAELDGHAVLTVPEGSFGELYERIDGQSRWAGAAAIDGALLRKTTAMLRDWDLQSTLLRRALQAHARHLAAEGPVAILDRLDDATGLEARILASAPESRGGWLSRLMAPIERALAHFLVPSPASPTLIGTAAALLTGLGAAAFGFRWFWTGLALMLLATPLDGVANRLGRVRMQEDQGRSWWSYLLPAFAGAGLLGLAYALAASHGWGMVLLGATTLAFLVALGIELEGGSPPGASLLAERKGMIWLMLPFAAFGRWEFGLLFLFAYATASFFWAQRHAHARPTTGQVKPQD